MVAVALGRSARRRLAPPLLALGLAFTVAAWSARGFDVAYGSEGMHISLAAIVSSVAVVTGGLAWMRYLRGGLLADVVIAVAFVPVIAGENIFALVLPTLLNHEVPVTSALWTSTGLELLSSALLFGAALAGGTVATRRQATLLLAGVAVAIAAVASTAVGLGSRLALPIDLALSPVAPHRHLFEGSTLALSIHGADAALLLAAGVVTTLRSDKSQAALFGWLAPALLVSALASFNYALFPSLYSYWVYSGDLLRLCFCLVLAWGIVFELRASVRRAIDLAVLEERRRLARDLHDGVAQELAFIATELVEVPRDLHPSIPWLRSAAERGLYESRRAIAALTMPLDRPLAELVASTVEEIAARTGVAITMNVDATLTMPPAMTEAVLRVLQEAVTNAVRHGRPTAVSVALHGRDGISLEVGDDGTGFDPGRTMTGFGLTSIRERIERTGGRLGVQANEGGGTRVSAHWPAAALRAASGS